MNPSPRFRNGAPLFALAVLAILPFAPSFNGGFLWDDGNINQNPLLRSFAGLLDIWLRPSRQPEEIHYWPVVYTSFWIEYQLWGLFAPGYRIVNALIHLANALLVWRIATRAGFRAPWLAAAFFAVHPIHVESVAWIIERKDTLSAFFSLLTANCWLTWLDDAAPVSRRRLALGATALAYMAALLSKSVAVTLPIGLLLLAVWHRRARPRAADLIALVPFVVLAVGAALLTTHAAASVPKVSSLPTSLADRLTIAARVFVVGCGRLLWPVDLSPLPPRWPAQPLLGVGGLWVAACGAIAAAAVLLSRRLRTPAPALALAFYVLTLGPTLGLIPHGFMVHSYIGDRFQYLASVAPLALLAAAISRCIPSNSTATASGGGLLPPARAAIPVAAILLFWALLSASYARAFTSNEALFRRVLADNPDSLAALTGLGGELNKRGAFSESVPMLERAVQLDPEWLLARNNLAAAYGATGRIDAARAQLEAVIATDPAAYSARYNLALCLLALGKPEEARTHLELCARTNPDDPDVAAALDELRRQTAR